MKQLILITGMLMAGAFTTAHATTPKEQYAMDTREAAARYAQDRAICDDERNQGQHMKCLRAAKAENNKALAAAKTNLQSATRNDRPAACVGCGRVLGVRVSEKDGESNALGVIGGGAAGALLGNQVGGGSGRALATVAGAVGGAYAGKKIQEKANATKVWTVDVEYDNGSKGAFTYDHNPGVQRGDRVRKSGQQLIRM